MRMSEDGCRSKATQSPDANELQKVIVALFYPTERDDDVSVGDTVPTRCDASAGSTTARFTRGG